MLAPSEEKTRAKAAQPCYKQEKRNKFMLSAHTPAHIPKQTGCRYSILDMFNTGSKYLYGSTVAICRVQTELGEHLHHQLAAVLIVRVQHRAQALHKVWGSYGGVHATATTGEGLHALQAG